MSATPCLHICSCSDRNNTRPSLLHPYLGSYLIAGTVIITPWGQRSWALAERNRRVFCQTALLAWLLVLLSESVYITHKASTWTQMSRSMSSSVMSCVIYLVCKQIPVIKSDFNTLLNVFSLSFPNLCVPVSAAKLWQTAWKAEILDLIWHDSALCWGLHRDVGSEKTIKSYFFPWLTHNIISCTISHKIFTV